jgi:hypothetical protein
MKKPISKIIPVDTMIHLPGIGSILPDDPSLRRRYVLNGDKYMVNSMAHPRPKKESPVIVSKKRESGIVLSVKDGVVSVKGLPHVKVGEMVEFLGSKVRNGP